MHAINVYNTHTLRAIEIASNYSECLSVIFYRTHSYMKRL